MSDAIRLTSPIFSEIAADSDHYPADDARFVIGTETISVHRQFLCMISPVLKNYFTNDSIESQTGAINVTDFTVDVVKNVVDFCYGCDVGAKTIPEIVDMLRFADKYDIKCVTKKLEHFPFESLNLDNFCIVVRYAYDLELSELFENCCEFYGKNVSSLALSEGFIGLPWEAQKKVSTTAFELMKGN
uniref:BTB domain-containing protein n=1 Tax=Panagrellus redivivus TaxID=6233 RepID=A0A7E4V9B2_PANRE